MAGVRPRCWGGCRDYTIALALSDLALAEYTARQDVVLTASVRLFQAELALKMGDTAQAAAQLEYARTLRQTIKRPVTPREQTRYENLSQALPALAG